MRDRKAVAQNLKPELGLEALMTKRASLIRRMFSSIAGRYDLLNRLLSLSLDRGWREEAVRLSGAGGEARVLDLCCGTGDLSLAFAHAGRAVRIVGVDFSREMLDHAARKAEATNIPWVQGDALALPFRDGSFDVVGIAFGVRNFACLSRGLAEAVRVLAAGGRIVVAEFSLPRGIVPKAVHRLYLRLILPVVARAVSPPGAGAYRYLSRSIIAFEEGEDLPGRLRALGLEGVASRALACGAVRLCVGTKRRGI